MISRGWATDTSLHRAGITAVQLAAALLLVWTFELETRAFFDVMLLACAGYLASVAAPMRLRLPLFTALSVISVPMALGMEAGIAVLAIGSVLIAICHLPLALRWRIALLVVVATALAALRVNPAAATLVPTAAVVIVASMFMFRVVLYLQAVRQGVVTTSVPLAASYFFMLPNVCFPLFPVVDFQTFARSRFDGEESSIYEQGVRLIFRGLVQLLIYRFVARELAIGETGANDLGDVVQHVFTTFLLYLQVSGRFHLIAGLLHLFGFRLPPTHQLYLLASSVTDFWRRINIYWKDFMVKLVFHPSYFRLRRHGTTTALVGSTVAVFLATWALHSYQHFWIEGSWLLSARDAGFWAAFAGLAVAVTLWEARRGAPRSLPRRQWSGRRALAVVGTILVIAVLWSFWEAESVATWLFMWTQARHVEASDAILLTALLVGGLAIAGFGWGLPQLGAPSSVAEPLRAQLVRAAWRLIATLSLVALTRSAVHPMLPPRVTQFVRHLQARVIPIEEQSFRYAAYYEKLNLAQAGLPYRAWRRVDAGRATPIDAFGIERTDDFLLRRLRPGFRNLVDGKTVSVNRWGMRDQDYELAKPAGTMRIAIIGPSSVMGWGVSDGETFEALVESSLDSQARPLGRRVEILNFSVPAIGLTQEVLTMASRAERFSPDVVLLTVNAFETPSLAWKLLEATTRGIAVPDAVLAALVTQAGITSRMSGQAIALRLRPVEAAWNRRLASLATETARRMRARVAVLTLRDVDQPGSTTLTPTRRAMRAEGVPVLECRDAFARHDAATLWVRADDTHPNALGHRLIAACLLQRLREHPDLLRPPSAVASLVR